MRTAFQSLQLIVTDFLPTMPCTCLSICVDVTAKFGLQCQDLNISLTAIGLLVRTVTASLLAVDSAVWILYILHVKWLACQKEHLAYGGTLNLTQSIMPIKVTHSISHEKFAM